VVRVPAGALTAQLSPAQLGQLARGCARQQLAAQTSAHPKVGTTKWPSGDAGQLRAFLRIEPRKRAAWQVEALADAFSACPPVAALPWPARLALFAEASLVEVFPGEGLPLGSFTVDGDTRARALAVAEALAADKAAAAAQAAADADAAAALAPPKESPRSPPPVLATVDSQKPPPTLATVSSPQSPPVQDPTPTVDVPPEDLGRPLTDAEREEAHERESDRLRDKMTGYMLDGPRRKDKAPASAAGAAEDGAGATAAASAEGTPAVSEVAATAAAAAAAAPEGGSVPASGAPTPLAATPEASPAAKSALTGIDLGIKKKEKRDRGKEPPKVPEKAYATADQRLFLVISGAVELQAAPRALLPALPEDSGAQDQQQVGFGAWVGGTRCQPASSSAVVPPPAMRGAFVPPASTKGIHQSMYRLPSHAVGSQSASRYRFSVFVVATFPRSAAVA
jgi:hypothetical protein